MVSKMQVILIRVCPEIDLLPCQGSIGCQSPSGFPSFLRPRPCPSLAFVYPSTFVCPSTLVLPSQAESTTHIHKQSEKAKLQNQLAKAAEAQNTILALYNATGSPIHAMTSISCLIISRSLLTIPSQSKQASPSQSFQASRLSIFCPPACKGVSGYHSKVSLYVYQQCA